ncbi:MAG: RNB domain-containing ribonuclease [Clostridia bacterium]|nr:RNB domain-containing ribonuclease [Clostridia bacterium]
MAYNDFLKGISAVYKYVFKNPGIHINTLKKYLLQEGKVASKEKVNTLISALHEQKTINIEKEKVSLANGLTSVGVLQKQGDKFYVLTPASNKRYNVDASIANGYNIGDCLDIVASCSKSGNMAFVLGRSKQEFNVKKELPLVQTKTIDKKENQETRDKSALILGRVVKLSHNNLVFIPNKKSIAVRQIPILGNIEDLAQFQDKICLLNLDNIENPSCGGYIVKVIGEAGNPISEYDAIAESYGAVMNFESRGLKEEIAKIPTSVDAQKLNLIEEKDAKLLQRNHVVDLRDLPFVTVDPATCKDMDDAIFSRVNENGDIECYVAVANVTKYFKLNSAIGKNYVNGTFTIYAPNKAYNILPPQLSTGICSLNPNEDRLAFVVKNVIDAKTGKVKDSNIYDAIIRSKHKYSYEEAQEIVDNLKPEYPSFNSLMIKALTEKTLTEDEQVLMNYYAATKIKTEFDNRQMIRFVANKEREIVFDADLDDVVDIKPVKHLFYHEVIEAFMISANETTAKYAKDNNLDNIYRVHDKPSATKTAKASEFFNILGISFDGDLTAHGTRNLIELIKGTPTEEVVNNFLIKMQSKAIYSDKLYSDKKEENDDENDWVGEKISHYALQSPHYSHTTSPIRRVPDYITQYNILAHMHGTEPIKKDEIVRIAEYSNERQLDIAQAEKDFEDISSVFYCEKHIGETMKGVVTKIRYTSPEECYDDDIVVIVKNESKGISAEIPLSQILGRRSDNYIISEQCCAVYDRAGNIVLNICKPIDFVITSADRKTMTIVGSH